MKILKNKNRRVFGVKYKLFTILKNTETNRYLYYLNSLGNSKVGGCMIYRSVEKSLILNRYTLSFLGVLFTLFDYVLKWPIVIVSMPFVMYCQGAVNYITDSVWVNNVRFFNNVNIALIIILTLLLVAF